MTLGVIYRIKEIDIMKKKLLAMMLAAGCALGAVPAATVARTPVAVEAATKKKAPSISKVYTAVKNAYGSDYRPTVRLKKDEIKTRFGISSSWYTSAIAEVPMISAHVDTLVIVRAKNADSKKKIKAALTKYRKSQIEDTHQYPMNLLKLQGSKVYVKGDYVCFFMLGTLDSKQENQEESKVIAAYKNLNNKAVNAVKKLYK